MIDIATKQKIRVKSDGDAGAYIMVPVDQLEEVTSVLEEAKITFWVDREAISLNGKPAVTVINLSRNAETDRIQCLLDDRA